MRRNTKNIGAFGEDAAEGYLKKRLWRILSRNFSARGGEIDIVGYRFGCLVYFEVKTRSSDAFGRPSDAVDGQKVSRIKAASREFLQTYCSDGRVSVFYPFGIELKRRIYRQRIDVIEIYLSPNGDITEINHIKDWENRL